VLDRALFEYEQSFIPDIDVELWPGAVLPQGEIARWFNENRSIYPVMSCKELVISRIKKWAENQALRYVGSSKEQERKKLSRSQVQKYLKFWPGHTVVELYRQILGEKPSRGQKLADVGAPDIPPRVSAESLTYFQRDEILPEDLAPLVYLKGKLRGFKDKRQLDHIVIDEAQDFSPFQVDLLRMLTRNNSFTILGDLSQGIHAYQGIQRWDELIECFEPEPTSYFTLESSYRSTFEIMTFANHVISAVGAPAALAKPVFRAGAPVRVVAAEPGALPSLIAETITAMQARQIASIAVIGRTEAACAELHRQLVAQGLELELITARQARYKGGLSIMPAYLTKGLEFDGVIVADAEPWAYGLTPRDSKLLYVACTRALHELVLFHGGAPSPLLPQTE
jgi:DNA helicase-2/ATP-dependent DNA helicase PcrA